MTTGAVKSAPVATELEELAERLRRFGAEREWEKFHTPKNLAMALAGEVGELLAEFQWLTPEESQRPDPENLGRIRGELTDVLNYLVQLADALEVDLVEAAYDKIDISERRYASDIYRGSARKAPPLSS